MSDVLRRFLDAAESGDTEAVTAVLVPEVQRALITAFGQAATPVTSAAASGLRRARSERVAPTIAAVSSRPQKTP